jgi:predicted ABC-type ATPase
MFGLAGLFRRTAKAEFVPPGYANVFKFNPNHEPGGSPKGGQFAKALGTMLVERLEDGGADSLKIKAHELQALLLKLHKGEEHINIMGMTVDGKKLFGDDGLGIPRKDMPQIPSGELRKTFLKELGVEVTKEKIDPSKLKPVQDEIDGKKVGGLYSAISDGAYKGDPVLISKDNYIIDGHHTWAGHVAMKFIEDPHFELNVYRVDMGRKALMDAAQKFTDENDIKRKDITKAQKDGFAFVFKFNPNHDELGRFSTGAGGTISTHSLVGYAKEHGLEHTVTADQLMEKLSPSERAEIKLALSKANAAPQTQSLYTDKEGQYTPERLALHQKIIDSYINGDKLKNALPAPGTQPTLIILGGRGGSGKSAFTNGTLNEFDASKFVTLDNDSIKAQLPEFKGWNAAQVHEESSHIESVLRSILLAKGANIISDKTLKSLSVESDIKQAIASGYRIEGDYMYLPPDKAASRVLSRYLGKGPGMRGRLVPPEVVLSMTKNEANFDSLKKYFSRWSEYDNSGSKPTLIERGGKDA